MVIAGREGAEALLRVYGVFYLSMESSLLEQDGDVADHISQDPTKDCRFTLEELKRRSGQRVGRGHKDFRTWLPPLAVQVKECHEFSWQFEKKDRFRL